MGNRRPATLLIIAGGIGLLVGSMLLAKFPGSDTFDPDAPVRQIWYDDPDTRLSLGLTVLLLALAVWHLRRFGLGKLLLISLLAAGALLFSLGDFGTGETAWSSDEFSGDELVGIWVSIGAAAIALVGALWSHIAERPAGTKSLWSYLFSSGPGGSDARPEGMVVEHGAEPPDGWWLASDGRWYPPESPSQDTATTADH